MKRSTHVILVYALLALSSTLSSTLLTAQTSFVYQRLRSIMNGKTEEVRKELVELSKEMPDEPGVMLLQAAIMDDGAKAAPIYERITRDFPDCEWADDAQLRLVQYHALRRDTVRAQRELANFKRSYPLSEYLIFAHDLVKTTVGLGKEGSKPGTPTAPASGAASTVPAAPSSTAPAKASFVKKEPAKDTAKKEPAAATLTAQAYVAPKDEEKKAWGWQIGSYSARKTAETEAQSYREQRMRVDVLEREGKFAVVVGHYSSRESAEKSRPLVEAQCSCAPYLIEKPLTR
ncbi:MAG: SPOR domain-containing protein [Candidatus Kapaibacterium sp.]